MLKYTVTYTAPKWVNWELEIEARFHERAGARVVEVIRDLLGTSEVYQLSPDYSLYKTGELLGSTILPNHKFKRFPGKASDQPLIASGAMWAGVAWWTEGSDLLVGVEESAGLSEDGFDYAQRMEEISRFLEQAFEKVREEFDTIMHEVVQQALGR